MTSSISNFNFKGMTFEEFLPIFKKCEDSYSLCNYRSTNEASIDDIKEYYQQTTYHIHIIFKSLKMY
jgi:hypothetical protein